MRTVKQGMIACVVIVILSIIFNILLIDMASAWEYKSYNQDTKTATFRSLPFFTKILDAELIDNTYQCGESCSALIKITTYKTIKKKDIDNFKFRFYDKKTNEEVTLAPNQVLNGWSVSISDKEKAFWEKEWKKDWQKDYVYYLKLEGNKKADKSVEWIPTFFKEIPEWALWNATINTYENITGQFKFDENTGNVTNDSINTIVQGTLNGNVNWTVGKINSAVAFDGLNTSFINITHNDSLNINSSTITYWIYINQSADSVANDTRMRILMKGEFDYALYAVSENSSNKWGIGEASIIRIGGGGGLINFNSDPLLDNNTWYHIASNRRLVDSNATQNTTTFNQIYINSILVLDESFSAIVSGVNLSYCNSNGNLIINPIDITGTCLSTTASLNTQLSFNGSIDDLRIYNGLISQSQISAIYNNGAGNQNQFFNYTVNISLVSPPNNTITNNNTNNFTVYINDTVGIKNVTLIIKSNAFVCYQETTNASTPGDGVCGLNYGGSYTIEPNYINMTYIKPANADSFSQVKYRRGITGANFIDFNSNTNANNCWNSNSTDLKMRFYSNDSGGFFSSESNIQCYNNTAWLDLDTPVLGFLGLCGTTTVPTKAFDGDFSTCTKFCNGNWKIQCGINEGDIYEEAMIWHINETLFTNITTSYSPGLFETIIGNVVSLTKGVYTWFYEMYDYANNFFTSETFTINITINGINNCTVIDEEGEYILTQSFNTTANNCITINADNVDFQGDSKTISGNSSNNAVLINNTQNVLIRDLILNNFTIGYSINNSLDTTIKNSTFIDVQNDIFLLSDGNNNTKLVNLILNNVSFIGNGAGSLINIEKSNLAKIVYLNPINASVNNFSSEVQLGFNFVSVNGSNLGLNKSAEITFFNLPTNMRLPKIFRDNRFCPSNICMNLTSLNAGNVTFNVTGWSNYTILDPDVVEISQTFNNETFETASETFIINISYFAPSWTSISANLVYNGTSYGGTQLGTGNNIQFTRTIDIPIGAPVVNSFHWVLMLSNSSGLFIANSTFNNQTVNPLIYGLCNSTLNVTAVNFTIYNESDASPINATFAGNFRFFFLGSGTTFKSVTFNEPSNHSFQFCTNPTNRTFIVTSTIVLNSPGFVEKTYNFNRERYNTNNITEQKLFMLGEGIGRFVIVQLTDTSLRPLVGHTTRLFRYYPTLALYLPIFNDLTDIYGQTTPQMIENTVKYKFEFYDPNNTLELATGEINLACRANPCILNFIVGTVPNYLEPLQNISNFDYSLTFNNNTNTFIYTWNDNTNTGVHTERLLVERNQLNGNILVCNITSSTLSGSLTCPVGNQSANYNAQAFRSSILKSIAQLNVSVDHPARRFGLEGLIWSFILLMTMIAVGYWNPTVGVTLFTIGFIFLGWSGIIYFNLEIGFAMVAIAVAFIWSLRS